MSIVAKIFREVHRCGMRGLTDMSTGGPPAGLQRVRLGSGLLVRSRCEMGGLVDVAAGRPAEGLQDAGVDMRHCGGP